MSVDAGVGSGGHGIPVGGVFGVLDSGLAEAAREAASGFIASLSAAMVLEGEARERALSIAGVELEMLLWLTRDARVAEASLVAGSRVDAFTLLAALGPGVMEEVLRGAVDALEGTGGIDGGLLEAFSMVTGANVDSGDDPVLAASAVIVSVAAAFNRLLAATA